MNNDETLPENESQAKKQPQNLIIGILFICIFFFLAGELGLILHECGHAIVGLLVGDKIEEFHFGVMNAYVRLAEGNNALTRPAGILFPFLIYMGLFLALPAIKNKWCKLFIKVGLFWSLFQIAQWIGFALFYKEYRFIGSSDCESFIRMTGVNQYVLATVIFVVLVLVYGFVSSYKGIFDKKQRKIMWIGFAIVVLLCLLSASKVKKMDRYCREFHLEASENTVLSDMTVFSQTIEWPDKGSKSFYAYAKTDALNVFWAFVLMKDDKVISYLYGTGPEIDRYKPVELPEGTYTVKVLLIDSQKEWTDFRKLVNLDSNPVVKFGESIEHYKIDGTVGIK